MNETQNALALFVVLLYVLCGVVRLAEDSFWLPAANWAFVLGTNAVEGAHVSSSGTLSFDPDLPKGSPRARRRRPTATQSPSLPRCRAASAPCRRRGGSGTR